jgi:hypothetical protein
MQYHTDIYSRALAEAKNELANLRVEFDRLAKRKAQLEAFITNTEPLLPAKPATLHFPPEVIENPPFPVPKFPQEEVPIWKAIVLSINGKGESFNVKDALEGLERIGRPVESPNKFQIVRAVLIRKTDYFEQIGPGLFALKKIKEDNGAMIPQMEGATEAAP